MLYVIFGLLFCYLSFDFISDRKKDFFILNYNWENLKNQTIGDVNVVDYMVKSLNIEIKDFFPVNNQNTFVINDTYYFRAVRIDRQVDQLNFIGVHWINEYPRNLNGTIKLGRSNLQLVQNSGTKITMIGDSQMGWREGKYTRKWIAEKMKVHFIGNRHDVFGYPYYFENNYTLQNVLQSNLNLDETEVVILYLGLHENPRDLHQNLKEFVTLNSEKEVIIIDSFLDDNSIESIDAKKVHYLDISHYNKRKYFSNDGIHLNYDGHKKLTQQLIAKLKSIGVDKK